MRWSICGHDIRETAKSCEECGNNLQIAGHTHQAKPESVNIPIATDAERKQITTLFSDLSGYTAMTERLDPEEVKEIIGNVFGEVKQVITKYEGFIERVIGDGVLAFFGVPRAHEDDPIRAILAALEIHGLVKSLSPHYEARIGAPLSMHSGLTLVWWSLQMWMKRAALTAWRMMRSMWLPV